MLALALIILVPVALLVAALGMFVLRHLHVLPPGVSDRVAYSLLSTVCLGVLLSWATLEELVVHPAQLQKQLVGRQLGSPLRLRHYETHGFQDPYYEWHYSLPPELLRKLKRECRNVLDPSSGQCLLADHQDGSWWQGIGLEGDKLWVVGSDS